MLKIDDIFKQVKKQYTHIFGLFTIIFLLVFMCNHYVTGEKIRMTDVGNYLSVGYNLAKYNHFGEGVSEEGEILDKGYYYQEPAYPFYLSMVFRLSKEFNNVSLTCMDHRPASKPCGSDSEANNASKVRLLVNRINFIVICMLVFVVMISSRIIFRDWKLVYLSGILIILFLPNFDQDILRSLFIIIHSILFYIYLTGTDINKRTIYGIFSGLFLGILALSAPVFLYYIYILGIVTFILGIIVLLKRIELPYKELFIIVVCSLIIVSPWIVRNLYYGEQITISGRGGLNLSQRLEYLTRDFQKEGRFINFLPTPFNQIAHKIYPYDRISTTNNTSYVGKAVTIALVRGLIEEGLLDKKYDIFSNNFPPYIRGGTNPDYDKIRKSSIDIIEKHIYNKDDSVVTKTAKIDKLLMKGDISILKDNFWLHTLYYSPLMAIRGSQFTINGIIRTNTFLFWMPLIIIIPLLLPSLIIVCLYAVCKKNFALLMFFQPAVFCHLFTSYLLIYKPRYSHQFVSLTVISLVMMIYLFHKNLKSKKQNLMSADKPVK